MFSTFEVEDLLLEMCREWKMEVPHVSFFSLVVKSMEKCEENSSPFCSLTSHFIAKCQKKKSSSI